MRSFQKRSIFIGNKTSLLISDFELNQLREHSGKRYICQPYDGRECELNVQQILKADSDRTSKPAAAGPPFDDLSAAVVRAGDMQRRLHHKLPKAEQDIEEWNSDRLPDRPRRPRFAHAPRVGVMSLINRQSSGVSLHCESVRIGDAGVPALTGSADIKLTPDSRCEHDRKDSARPEFP